MKRALSAAVLMIVACAPAACREESQPAAAGAAPELATIGALIGPQPGVPATLDTTVNPFAGDAAARMEGRRLFLWYNCAGCHGGHAGGGMGPSLRDSAWIYGNSDEDIFNSIAAGRARGMPAWGLKLPREQIWKLVGYVTTLGTPNEAAPPPPLPPLPPPLPEQR